MIPGKRRADLEGKGRKGVGELLLGEYMWVELTLSGTPATKPANDWGTAYGLEAGTHPALLIHGPDGSLRTLWVTALDKRSWDGNKDRPSLRPSVGLHSRRWNKTEEEFVDTEEWHGWLDRGDWWPELPPGRKDIKSFNTRKSS